MKACLKHPAFLVALSVLVFSAMPAVADNRPIAAKRAPDKQVMLNLLTLDSGNIELLVDGLSVFYNNGYLLSTADDVVKTAKMGENISSYRESKDLELERRPLFNNTDTIFLHIINTSIRNYRFKINMQQFNVTGLMAKLEDSYLKTFRILDTYGSTSNIDFSVTADAASADPFRFRIVIITALPLPVTITSFAATQAGKNIALEWKVSNQLNMLEYEIEKSANGINFTKAATVPVVGNSSYTYQWLDEQVTTGNMQHPVNNFYRVRCIGIGGYINFSKVISIKAGYPISGISIFPNPVTNNIISMQFTNMQEGFYALRLLNSTGQVLFTQTINHSGINGTQTIMPLSSMVKENYYLGITGPGNLKMTKLISVAK